MNEIGIHDSIKDELKIFKFTRNSLSYQYLIDAISIVSMNPLAIKDFKNTVYNQIAKKYNTRSENIQWCLSKIVFTMLLNTDKNVIYNYFRICEEDKITPKEFIIFIGENVKNKGLVKK